MAKAAAEHVIKNGSERIMKNKKPVAPWLPGRFGRMTCKQLAAESDRYDVEFSAIGAKRVANVKPHPRKRRGSKA
jgi:hypothetical protein